MKTRALSLISTARRALHAVVSTGAVAGIAAMLSPPATGQVYVGGEGPPNVVIDYGVLDALGPPPSVPQVLMERPAGRPAAPYSYSSGPRFPLLSGSGRWQHEGPVVLKPPAAVNQRPARAARNAAPKLKPPPRKPAPAARQAAAPRIPAAPDIVEAPKPAPRKEAAEVSGRSTPEALMPPPPPKIEPAPAAKAPPPEPSPRVNVAKMPDPPTPPEPPQSVLPVAASAPPVDEAPPAPPRAAATSAVIKTAGAAPKANAATQLAVMPRAEPAIRPGTLRRIGFVAGSAKLNGSAAEELKAVAEAMARDEALRIQLLAYAGQAGDSESQARRLSLSRALAARSQLIEQGVRSTRIDVRALGNNSAGGPAERVDIIVTKR